MILTCVIASHNRKELLFKLIEHLLTQNLHPYELKIIVIDDGSTDGTSEMISKTFPEVIIIRGDGTWWWTKSMNAGFKKALEIDSDFVLILNDDNEIKPDFLKILAESYIKIPENSILGSMSLSLDYPELIEMSGTKSFNRFWLKSKQYQKLYTREMSGVDIILPTYSLCGRGTLIPRIVFETIGFFDEKLIQYGSDDEFIWRARKNKIKTFISWGLKVYNHTYLTSSASAVKMISFWGFTKSFFNIHSSNSLYKDIYLYRRYGYPIFLPIFLVYTILGSYKSFLVNYRRIKR